MKKLSKGKEVNKFYSKVRYAIKTGKIVKQPCEICGEIKVEAHHSDYNKPLKVMWLCKEHHLSQHGRNGIIKNHKICGDCKKRKPIKEFTKRGKTGWTNAYCKKCMSNRAMIWAKKNKNKYKIYQYNWQKNHVKKM